MSKTIIAIIIIIIVGGSGYWIYQSISAPQGITEAEAKNCEVDTDCVVFGEDGDCNCGCFNKNYQWKKEGDCFCAAPKSCKCVNGKCEGVFEENKKAAIKNLFADKYNKTIAEVTINISQETENHIKGMVEISPGGPENSGMFLAAKVNDSWNLVYDGQGSIICLAIGSYNFPVDMVEECVGGDGSIEYRKIEAACVSSRGEVMASLCCKSVGDFPNLCLVGPCGCSPEHSHKVKICNCGEGKCFDGNTCVPEINSFDDCVDAGYSILPPTPGGYTECRTPDGKVFYFEEIIVSPCAKDGEVFSRASDQYLDSCCEGLKEWIPIPDTRFSIADVCYEVGSPSESNIGLCIKCGDGVCENHPQYNENPCNCPEDCAGKNKSMFQSIEEFCQSNDWKMSLSKACEEQEPIKGSPICELCAF